MAVIMLLEDNADMLLALTEALEINQHEVFPRPTGQHGLDALNNGECQPEVIITDVRMPQMDGLTFVQNVRANPVWAGIPIALMSGQERDMDYVEEVGADAFIPKPFKFEQLAETVEILLTIAQQQQSRR